MGCIKPLTASLLILAFVVGGGVGCFLAPQNAPGTVADDRCPAEITSLDALTVALHDPEVVGLLDNKSINTIVFSKGSYPERDMNYTQIVFHPLDPDPDDRMTASMIVVQVNDSCMVHSVYETYPSYIPEAPPLRHEAYRSSVSSGYSAGERRRPPDTHTATIRGTPFALRRAAAAFAPSFSVLP
ncbi:MAG: hypothetical protein PWR21_884 [Methanoculleus sp.]|nr:hypothetical protein [Methanoculleus sp.]